MQSRDREICPGIFCEFLPNEAALKSFLSFLVLEDFSAKIVT